MYTPVPAVSAGDWIDEVFINTYWVDNFAAGVPDVFSAKGQLAVGLGVDSMGILNVGADGTILVADSTQALGVRWGTTPDSSNYIKLASAITGYNGNSIAVGTYSLSKTALAVPSTARAVLLSISAMWTAANNGNYAKIGPAGELGAINGLIVRALLANYSIDGYGLVFFSGVGETGTISLTVAGLSASIYLSKYGYVE